MTFDLGKAGIKGILLDVEGTVTPVDFVYGTLFPYARTNLGAYLATNPDGHVQILVDQLSRERQEEAVQGGIPQWDSRDPVRSAQEYAEWLMDRDRKSTALKALQGRVWKSGYLAGTLRGGLFADVEPALGRWKARGLSIRIFSSGSILAQKLLFRHSVCGDLSRHLDGYFDTTTGPKTESASYRAIATAWGLLPGSILFVSDSPGELLAASAVGYRVVRSVRAGNPPSDEAWEGACLTSFEEIRF